MQKTIPFLLVLIAAALVSATQQDLPLAHKFQPGEATVFRIELTARSEVEGQRAEKIGVRAYAVPFNVLSEEKLSWQATIRVLAVDPQGVAEIEEIDDGFSPLEAPPENAGGQKEKTDAALRLALLEWSRAGRIVLRYRQTPRGEIAGLPPVAGPILDAEPAVLSAWLRSAIRPRALLRGALGGPDARWSEPRSAQLPPWTGVRGTESGEWLPGPYPQLSLVRFDNLQVTQQIQATVPAIAGVIGEGEARFHSESISTVVGAGSLVFGPYGSLVLGSRAATREVSRRLPPVEGLPEPPRFRNKISVELRITRSDWPPK